LIIIGFLINLPIGGPVALLLLFVSIPDYRKEEDKKQSVLEKVKKLDLPGFFLFAPTVIMLLLALEWGGTKYAWKSATVIGLFCGSFGNLLLFLAWEHRVGAEAMIPLHLLKNRIVWSSCLNMGFFISYVYTMVYYFPIYFQAVKGASPIASGVDFLPQILMQMVTTIVAGGLGMPILYCPRFDNC
jgi:hypothetical protein